MAFNPKIYVKFDKDSYSNPVQAVWDWCESMEIEFDFLGFDTKDTPKTIQSVTVSIWQVQDEMDNITFQLRWDCI